MSENGNDRALAVLAQGQSQMTAAIREIAQNFTTAQTLRQILLASGYDPDAAPFRGFASLTNTVNAGNALFTGTKEARITQAIALAVLLGWTLVYIPVRAWDGVALMPYDASLVATLGTWGGRVIREGGDPTKFDMLAYGAAPGGADCTPARNAATAAAIAVSGGTVYYPPGFWYHLTTPTIVEGDDLNITFAGEGANASGVVLGAEGVVLFGVANGGTRFHVRDLWIGSFAARAAGYGIQAISTGWPNNQVSEVTVERVTLQNLPSPLHFDQVGGSTIRDVRYLQTIATATVGVVFYLRRAVECHLQDMLLMCTAGSLPSDAVRIDSNSEVQALRCSMVLMGNGANSVGWHLMDSIGASPPRYVYLTNCYGENGYLGFWVEAGEDVRMTTCETANNSADGWLIAGGDGGTITGSTAYVNQHHGISQTGGTGWSFTDNMLTNNSQATNNTYDGIHIGSNCIGTTATGNKSGEIMRVLAVKQRYGIYLDGTGTDYLTVTGNHCSVGNVSAGLANFSSGSHNVILDENTWTRTVAKIKTLTDAATIADVDPRLGTIQTVTLGGNRTMGVALDGANWIAGQRLTFLITQDGTGGRTLAWHGSYKVVWSDAGNAAGKRSVVSVVNAGDGTWAQDGAQAPYV